MTYDPWKTYSSNPDEILLHATAVAVDGSGLLILGPSGSGKSSLAIEILALGADLICAPLKYCIDLSLMSDVRLPFAQEVTKFGHNVLVFPGAKIVPKAAALVLLVKNGFSVYS